MTSGQQFICFKHCSKFVFCKRIVHICPVCGTENPDYVVQPFQVPYPFTKANQKPVSIVIRPSKGDFFKYNINDDLHIGIVDSSASIYEFDKCGLVINDISTWDCCIAIKIVPESWHDHWDETLKLVISSSKWVVSNYDVTSMNCFNFVIDFLRKLKFKTSESLDKEILCRDYILPKIKEVVKYTIALSKLKNRDYFVQD